VKATGTGGQHSSAQIFRGFAKDIAVSLLYTALIVVLIKLKIIQPISN
jgi:hypothetical protein